MGAELPCMSNSPCAAFIHQAFANMSLLPDAADADRLVIEALCSLHRKADGSSPAVP